MSEAVSRVLVHTREVVCLGYRRADGLWDIEARMTDKKGYRVQNDFRDVRAGEPFHDMALCVTVDESLAIVSVKASISAAPHRVCPTVTPNFQRLVGLRISAGFNGELRRRLGGVEGCTHLVELFGPLATSAIQSVRPLAPTPLRSEGERPSQIDSCHALVATGEVVARYWPRFYASAQKS